MNNPPQPGESSAAEGQRPEKKGGSRRTRLLGWLVAIIGWSAVLAAWEFPGSDKVRVGFAVLLFVLIPLQSIRGYYHLKRGRPLPHKHLRYFVSMFAEGALLVVGFRVGYSLAPEWFHAALGHPVAILVAGGLAVAPMLAAYQKWKRPGATQELPLHSLLPVTAGELVFWIPVALLAGTAEEIAYRGVAVALVHRWTGSAALAVGVSAVAFGLAHVTHGGRAALGTALFGLSMQFVFFLTGTLYLPMLVHALYDLLLGVMFIVMSRQAGEAAGPAPLPSG